MGRADLVIGMYGSIPEVLPPHKTWYESLAQADRKVAIYRQYRIGDAQDQGNQPQCVGFACSNLLRADPIRQNPFSPQHLYKAARQRGRIPENTDGAKLTDAIDYMKEKGAVKKDYWTTDADQVGQHVFEISPVVLSIPWYNRMDTPTKGRIEPKGSLVGFHAVLAYAYDGLKKRIFLQNQWGKAWGLEGNCWMTLADFRKVMQKGGIGCAVSETAL